MAQSSGKIVLDTLFKEGNMIVVKPSVIDTQLTSTTSRNSKFRLTVSEDDEEYAFALDIRPFPRRITLHSQDESITSDATIRDAFPTLKEHTIIINWENNRFHLICDLNLIGTVEDAGTAPFKPTIKYDLGEQFSGQVSATLYNDLKSMVAGSSQEFQDFYRSCFPLVDSMELFQTVISADPSNEKVIPKTLEKIRKEITFFNSSSSNVKWQGQVIHRDARNTWIDGLTWDMKYGSIFVVRFIYPKVLSASSLPQGIQLRSNSGPIIHVAITYVGNIGVYEQGDYSQVERGTIDFFQSFLLPGEHSVAFINNGGNINVIFDFSKYIVFQNQSGATRKIEGVLINGASDTIVEVDTYRFG